MDNKPSEEHREFTRVSTRVHVRISARGREDISQETHDISMKGLFINGKLDLPVGTECEIHLLVEGQTPPLDLSVKGRVQRQTEEGLAFLFTEVGLEAYEHLHNVILFNTQDPDKVSQEFKDHLGLKPK